MFCPKTSFPEIFEVSGLQLCDDFHGLGILNLILARHGNAAGGEKRDAEDDGDVAGVIATSDPDTTVDLYMGQGGAPEGVLAAAALRCVGGQMQGRLILDTEEKRQRAATMGVKDPNKKYDMSEMASGDVIVCATGVTDGGFTELLRGDGFAGFLADANLVVRMALRPNANGDGNEPYLLGFFLMGAYQDIMGDLHNLFGRVNEAHVFLEDDEADGFYIEESIPGYSVERILGMIQYNAEDLCRMLKRQVDRATKADSVRPREGVAMVDLYERLIRGRTYLIPQREEAEAKKPAKKKK